MADHGVVHDEVRGGARDGGAHDEVRDVVDHDAVAHDEGRDGGAHDVVRGEVRDGGVRGAVCDAVRGEARGVGHCVPDEGARGGVRDDDHDDVQVLFLYRQIALGQFRSQSPRSHQHGASPGHRIAFSIVC